MYYLYPSKTLLKLTAIKAIIYFTHFGLYCQVAPSGGEGVLTLTLSRIKMLS